MSHVIVKKVDRAKTFARVASNPDFKLKHVAWVRAAAKDDYFELERDVKLEVDKIQKEALARRQKLVGKS